MSFDNQVILITGAGRGLGFAYARELAARGATILLQDVGAAADGTGRDPHVAEDAAAEICASGHDAVAIFGSLETREGCHQLIERSLELCGRLDAIIHNSGWVSYQQVEEIDETDFDHMMTIAAKAPLWLAQAAWPVMKQAGYGRILITTSCRALFPQYAQKGLAAYAAAKMAAIGIVNVLAEEGGPFGIVVNAISPVAKTRIWGLEEAPDELLPAEVAPGAAFLVSDACVDGGWILRAANGQFHATRTVEAEDVDNPRDINAIKASTIEEVAALWPQIAVPAIEPR